MERRGSGHHQFEPLRSEGSPTIVKKVFAPPARAEKAFQIEVADKSYEDICDALLGEVYKRQPALEQDMVKMAPSY